MGNSESRGHGESDHVVSDAHEKEATVERGGAKGNYRGDEETVGDGEGCGEEGGEDLGPVKQ
jgi:hypothetical protein